MLNDALEVFSDNSELESVLLRNLKQSFEFFLSQYSLNIGYVYKSQTNFANTSFFLITNKYYFDTNFFLLLSCMFFNNKLDK